MQLETEVQKGDDAFLITDSFLYFSMVECDVNWLMSQANIVVDNANGFIVQDVLAYVLNKISTVDPESVDKQILKRLFKNLKDVTDKE
ncbi:hypothetical protein [Oceanobacillus manasiensis]|uniref:hypothetical protein n=1 Tax=Oceanobacillus manasiensis TaxID=586413 RepID=UPI0005A77532|nr:hypothetical protein [Oceanobacillus manasiensis]